MFMKRETKESVKESLLDIDEKLGGSAGAGRLHEGMSDEEFKELVQTLTQDVIREFEDAKKRAYEEGFQAGLKAAGESKPLVITQQPSFERELSELSQKIEGLSSEHEKIHRQLEDADRSLHSEIRELRDEIEALKQKPAEEETVEEEEAREILPELEAEAPSEERPEEPEETKEEEPRKPPRAARRVHRRKRRR